MCFIHFIWVVPLQSKRSNAIMGEYSLKWLTQIKKIAIKNNLSLLLNQFGGIISNLPWLIKQGTIYKYLFIMLYTKKNTVICISSNS